MFKKQCRGKTNFVLSKWKEFENNIVKKPLNEDYFYQFQDDDETKVIYNFDGYYKGRTINEDLKEFTFNECE